MDACRRINTIEGKGIGQILITHNIFSYRRHFYPSPNHGTYIILTFIFYFTRDADGTVPIG